jgi:cyclase
VNRRLFLSAVVPAAGATLVLPQWAFAADKKEAAALTVSELTDKLFVISGGGGNVTVFNSPEGVLLVDGGSPERSAEVLKLVKKRTGASKIHTLINTHWHWDQTGSNEALGKAGTRIIAHENTRLWLTRRIDVDWSPKPFPALPKSAQPNKSFYTTDKLEFGGETIALGHLGQAHTDGDLYAYLPKSNVLVAGGVVSSAGWPLVDWQTGGWIGGLVGAYDRLLKIANDGTKVIPANGAVVGRKELQAYRDMYFQIFDRLVKQLIKGMGPEEAYQSAPAKEYEAQWGDSHAFVVASFRSLWGHYAPDA